MRRLFWMGVGAVGAVVVAQRARSALTRLPDAVTSRVAQAGRAGRWTSSTLRETVAAFRAARTEREAELVAALLAEPEDAAVRRPRTRRDTSPSGGARGSDPDPWDDDPWGPGEDDL